MKSLPSLCVVFLFWGVNRSMRNHRKQMSLSWKEPFHISLIVTVPEGFFGGIFIWNKLKIAAKKTKDKKTKCFSALSTQCKKKTILKNWSMQSNTSNECVTLITHRVREPLLFTHHKRCIQLSSKYDHCSNHQGQYIPCRFLLINRLLNSVADKIISLTHT